MMWRFEGFPSMDGSIYVGVEGFQHGKNFPSMHMLKAPRWEKGNCAILESTHLRNMSVVIYNKGKS